MRDHVVRTLVVRGCDLNLVSSPPRLLPDQIKSGSGLRRLAVSLLLASAINDLRNRSSQVRPWIDSLR